MCNLLKLLYITTTKSDPLPLLEFTLRGAYGQKQVNRRIIGDGFLYLLYFRCGEDSNTQCDKANGRFRRLPYPDRTQSFHDDLAPVNYLFDYTGELKDIVIDLLMTKRTRCWGGRKATQERLNHKPLPYLKLFLLAFIPPM